MITETQALTQRVNDTALITTARVTLFLNQAQKRIAERTPGLIDLQTKDTSSLTLAADQLAYSFASFSPAVCHLLAVFYIDTTSSVPLKFMMLDEFDEKWPSPTDLDTNQPIWWTRRANTIEVWPVPSSSHEKTLRVDYTGYPGDMGGTVVEAGLATSATATTLVDTTKTWTADLHNGRYVFIIDGTGAGQNRVIIDTLTSETITVATWDITPSTDSVYLIGTARTSSQILNADEGLIEFAVSKSFAAAGMEDLSIASRQKFELWLDGFKAKNSLLPAWDGDTLYH